MKRGIMLFLMLSVLLLTVTGCHGSRGIDAFSVPTDLDESRSYEVTFWAKNDTNKTQVDIYQRAIDEFEALYPNITVTMRLYTDYARIYNDVITNIATNTPPDVCITYPDHIATYLTGNNVVVNLDSLISDAKYGLHGSEVRFDSPATSDMIERYLQEGLLYGHLYAVPFVRSTEICYINKTYVEALGYTLPDVLTWDFIWEVSEKATEKNDDGTYKINGQNVMIPFIYKSTDNMMIQMLKQLDAGYSTDAGEILMFNDDTKKLLQEISPHAATGAFSTFKISGYPANFLDAGQCIFAVDSSAGATWMGSKAPLSDISADKIVDFETAVMLPPQYDAEHPSVISQGPSICLFNRGDAQQVLASWLFAQYLLTDDIQIAYAQTEGYIPVTQSARDTQVYRDYLAHDAEDNSLYYDVKIRATKLLLENIENTFITPVFNGSASLRSAAGQLIEDTVKSTRRKQTIDDAFFEKIFDSNASLYHLDQVSAERDVTQEPLPTASKVLLGSLVLVWVCIICVYFVQIRKKKRKSIDFHA